MRREHDNCTRFLQDILGMTFDVSTGMNMRLLHHTFIRNAYVTCCHYMPSIGALEIAHFRWKCQPAPAKHAHHRPGAQYWQGRGANVDCGRREYCLGASRAYCTQKLQPWPDL